MATTEKYYIEELESGDSLNTDGTWSRFLPGGSARSFSDKSSAVSHIDTLANGEYRVFLRIAKTD